MPLNPHDGSSRSDETLQRSSARRTVALHNSPVGLATIHVFHRYGVPQMFWGGIHPDITNKYNYLEVTRIRPDTNVEHYTLATFVVKKLGYKDWSIIYDVTSYGKSCLDAVKSALNRTGGKILSEDGIPVGGVDFRPILSKIKALNQGHR